MYEKNSTNTVLVVEFFLSDRRCFDKFVAAILSVVEAFALIFSTLQDEARPLLVQIGLHYVFLVFKYYAWLLFQDDS